MGFFSKQALFRTVHLHLTHSTRQSPSVVVVASDLLEYFTFLAKHIALIYNG